MSTSTPTQNTPSESVVLSRLLWAAPTAIALAVVANAVIYIIADALFGVAWEPSYNLFSVIVSTIVQLFVAALVFAGVARFSKRPLWLYRRIAVVALFLSCCRSRRCWGWPPRLAVGWPPRRLTPSSPCSSCTSPLTSLACRSSSASPAPRKKPKPVRSGIQRSQRWTQTLNTPSKRMG